MNRYISILSLIWCTFLFSQKNIQYFDEYNNPVSKSEYEKAFDRTKNLKVTLDTDTSRIEILVTRENIGRLDSIQFKSLKNYLRINSPLQELENKYIVINYITSYPKIKKKEPPSRWSIFRESYVDEILNQVDSQIYWIYDESQEYIFNYDFNHIHWIKEEKDIVKNLFYPYVFNYGNVTIIDQNGNYFSFFGEYGIEKVLLGIKFLKKLPRN